MAARQEGKEIHIPCEVSEGAFPGELLVTVDTKIGPISGFVRRSDVHSSRSGSHYLVGVVEDVTDDTVVVRLKGSFFRTTGIAYFRKDALFHYA